MRQYQQTHNDPSPIVSQGPQSSPPTVDSERVQDLVRTVDQQRRRISRLEQRITQLESLIANIRS